MYPSMLTGMFDGLHYCSDCHSCCHQPSMKLQREFYLPKINEKTESPKNLAYFVLFPYLKGNPQAICCILALILRLEH